MPSLHTLGGSLGRLWKVHRRQLPADVRHCSAELLLAVRRELLPIPGLGPEEDLDRSRYDVRRISYLFVAIAGRRPVEKVCIPSRPTGKIIRLADHLQGDTGATLTRKNTFLEMVLPACCFGSSRFVYLAGALLFDRLVDL